MGKGIPSRKYLQSLYGGWRVALNKGAKKRMVGAEYKQGYDRNAVGRSQLGICMFKTSRAQTGVL